MSNQQLPTPPENLKKAAEAGGAAAQYDLGRWYAENLPETPYAEVWFKRAAKKGLPKAYHGLGVVASKFEEYEIAVEWFEEALARNWLDSTIPLSSLLAEFGDIKGALEILDRGARRGHRDSQEVLSDLIVQEDIESHHDLAYFLGERFTQLSNASARSRLGVADHERLGIDQSPKPSVSWFLKADRGDTFAQLMIGGFYHKGIGVEANRITAIVFLSVSAGLGNPSAQAYLPDVEAELTSEERSQLERMRATHTSTAPSRSWFKR